MDVVLDSKQFNSPTHRHRPKTKEQKQAEIDKQLKEVVIDPAK